MKGSLAIALLTIGFLGADSAGDAAKKDIDKWQGAWQATSMISDGKPVPPEKWKNMRLTVTGTSYHFQNGDFSEHGTYKFNPEKTPAEIDIVVGDGPDKGKNHLAVYSVDSDRLAVCLDSANKHRPGSLDAKAGSGYVLEVWERVKPNGKSEFARGTIDLGVVVSNLEKSVEFYKQVIGLKEVPGFTVGAEFCADAGLTDKHALTIRVLQLEDGENATKVKLMSVPAAKVEKSDTAFIHSQLGYRYITIFVADADAALARLNKAGIKPLGKGPLPLPPGFPAGMALAVIRDPDGNIIELIGPKR